MAKDYGRRKPVRQKSSASKQFFWILASFLVGYLTATVFDFTSLSTWVNSNILAKKEEQKPASAIVAKKAETPKPKFEFYTLLAKDQSGPARLPPPVATIPAKPLVQPVPNQAVAVTNSPPSTVQVAKATVVGAVPIPVKDAKAIASITPANKGAYLIQVASFKNRQDAERMKATLTLKGFDVSIATASQQNVNWFRVIVGPFGSRIQAEKTQVNLAHNERIHGMIRKMEA